MRHMTRRKKPKLNSFTNIKQLLHSIIKSKSTYFYSNDGNSLVKSSCDNSTTDFRWASSHCEQSIGDVRRLDFANRTQPSREKKSYSRIARGRTVYLLPVVCITALLLVLGFSINPISAQNNHQAFAETNASAQSNDIVPENGVALRIDTALNDKDTVEEQVTGTGTQYIKVDFTVGANNIQNYDVYVQADSTALTGQSHGDKLQSITSDSTGTVGTKQWGYSVSRGSVDPSTMTYRPIQTSVSTSADSQDAGEGNTLTSISQPYTLAFAANLEGAASDHYKSNITLSVAVGATDIVKTWDQLVYMQDMNPTACSQAPLNAQKTLIDSRDGNTYTIARIKNQTNDEARCWMIQNLRLVGNRTLTPEDSDVDKAYILPTPVTISSSDDPKHFTSSDSEQSIVYYNASHGAYYNWHTATTGSYYIDTTTLYGDTVLYSICPKGWRLPIGGKYGDFYNLVTGLTIGQSESFPYNYSHSGVVSNSELGGTGNGVYGSGYYWSSMTYNTGSYYLRAGGNTGGELNYEARYKGMSVRCIAK